MQKTKHPLAALIALLILGSLILFGLIFFLIPQPSGVDIDDSAGTEVLENSTYFTNYFFIEDYIGSKNQHIIFDNISSFILSQSELDSAPSKNTSTTETNNIYTVDTDINSYHELSPYPTISLDLTISDQRKYKLYLYTDKDFSEKYIATAIKNTLTEKSALYINSKTESYNDILKQWGTTVLSTPNYIFTFNQI
ncbi:hypothetical protein IJG27_03575 [Candidatus Saccharibacteria bacterium]|nr:hypothetical protein [Candidatus Saccharibacteria bacterium]MBQ3467973.1 hypothetical protein [Candidatus Saccharibacteria bacterium]